MYIFKPYDRPINKQIHVSSVPSASITDKTIMRQITKNDDFYLLNKDDIIINEFDKNMIIDGKTYIVTIDNSVWVLKGQFTDMNGVAIPSTYSLLLLGKLETIEIDIEKIKENEEKSSHFDEYKEIAGYYERIVTYVMNLYDPSDTLESKCTVDWKNNQSVYFYIKFVLESRLSDYEKMKSKIKKLKIGIMLIIIFSIISFFV